MNADETNLPPPYVPPMALAYSSLGPTRPGAITVIAIIGIVVASLGLIVGAFTALSALSMAMMSRAMPTMQWQSTGAAAATVCEGIVGAALAGALLTGSVGLLKLRPWSRRLLIWWAWGYLASVAVFLLLQIVVVVPSQVAMMTKIMSTMPRPAPATMPATAPATSSTSTVVYSYSAGGSSSSTTTTTGPAMTTTAPMMAMMKVMYTIMAFGKAVICLIFPIAVLIVMRLESVRTALAPKNSQQI